MLVSLTKEQFMEKYQKDKLKDKEYKDYQAYRKENYKAIMKDYYAGKKKDRDKIIYG